MIETIFSKSEWVYYEYRLYQIEGVGLDTLQINDGLEVISAKKSKCRNLTQHTKVVSDWFSVWEAEMRRRDIDQHTIRHILSDKWLMLCDSKDIQDRANLFIKVGDYIRNKI